MKYFIYLWICQIYILFDMYPSRRPTRLVQLRVRNSIVRFRADVFVSVFYHAVQFIYDVFGRGSLMETNCSVRWPFDDVAQHARSTLGEFLRSYNMLRRVVLTDLNDFLKITCVRSFRKIIMRKVSLKSTKIKVNKIYL